MARFNFEDFANRKPTLVYIAGNMVDAEKVEKALNENGMDYAVSVEPYVNTALIGGMYQGLFVYVSDLDAEKSRTALEAHGLQDIVDLQDVGES